MPRPSLLLVLPFVGLLLTLFSPIAETAAAAPFFQTSGTNVALAQNGAIATASSTFSEGRPASSVINGDRKGLNWGNGGGWTDLTANEYPDWLQVDFPAIQTISEIDVFTIQDNFSNPAEPTLSMTFSQYGITSFNVQYWDGSNWATFSGGSVTGNNKVWRQFTFAAITTTKIRIYVTNSLSSYSRLIEVEAWTPSQRPSVSITSPSDGTTLVNTNPVTINATASDADGTITKVEFFQGGVKLGESTTSPYSYVWNNVQPGSYSLTARATDNSSTVSTSSPVNIVMPVGWISGRVTRIDGTTGIVGAAVKIYQGSTLQGTASTNAAGDYSIGLLNAGTYTAEASATGYETNTQSGIVVTTGTTTLNMSLATPIQYVYDALGRLTAVIDKDGNAATYSYDAVGNLLSISRLVPTQTSIIQFSPSSGPVGAGVTVYGTGFSPSPSQNTVTFNGVGATVISATLTQLVTIVPAGATTGPIGVSCPVGSITSNSAFTVTSAASGAPTITNFTPTIGAPGTTVTITGTNFETIPSNNVTKFNIVHSANTSATSNNIVTTVPATTSGRISVTTPAGTGVSGPDFFCPPTPYAASDVVVTGRIAFGETKPVTINTGNKVGLYLFDGIAGRRVGLNVSGRTISHSQVTIYSPDRKVLTTSSFYSWQGDIFYEPQVLPVSGTYTILVASLDGTTGGMNLTPYDVPADTTGTIAIGGLPVTVILSPGQNNTLSFSATAGQKISISTSNSAISACDVVVRKPDGSQVGGIFPAGTGTSFMDTVVLPVTGQYSIVVDPRAVASGSITLALNNTMDVTANLTVGGTPVTITTTAPGQNALLSFNGTAGQRISLNFTGKTFTECSVYVRKPDGSVWYSQYMPSWWTSAFMDSTTLPVSGTYTILVDPALQYTGSLTMTLYDTTADVTGSISVGGQPVTINIPTPGQNGVLTFSATAAHRVGLNLSNVTITGSTVTIKKADGTTVASIGVSGGGGFLETSPLAVTGTYTILVDPGGTYTGNMTLTLTDITDVTGSVTAGGAPLTLTTTTAGQDMRASFTGAAGQRISLKISISLNCYVTIYKPDGAALGSQIFISGGSGMGFIDTTVLPLAGNYVIILDISGTPTGSATFTLYDVPADASGALTIGGASLTVTISTPGQNGLITFSGTSGQQVTVRVTSNTISSVTIKLLKPDGSQLTSTSSSSSSFNLAQQTLPTSGTYTIVVDPNGTSTGALNVNVTSP